MKFITYLLMTFIFLAQVSCNSTKHGRKTVSENIPTLLKGDFRDDYGIRFTISDSIWMQHPNVKYHILSWDTTAQYLLARNDRKNPSDTGLYTRIDYMLLPDMEPFRWGFCLTVYKATTIEEAKRSASADRKNPKKGCNGYPFSRMERVY